MARVPDWVTRGRAGWRNRGRSRPPFAITPGPGQESVWDYPRPPALQRDSRLVTVKLADTVVAASREAIRVLETASPPTFYLPPHHVDTALLQPSTETSFCEWKGAAQYWDVIVPGQQATIGAWNYPRPFPEFEDIKGYFSFYPARVECCVANERVMPQPGNFYGGWVTSEIVGPFKGDPGSSSW